MQDEQGKCADHNPFHDKESGEIICRSCGFVFEDRVQAEEVRRQVIDPETNELGSEHNDPSRIMDIPVMGALIGNKHVDILGKPLSQDTERNIGRLRKLEYRVRTSIKTEKVMAEVNPILGSLFQKLGITDNAIKMDVMNLYQKSAESGLTKGRSVKSMIGASVYTMLKRNRVPRTPSDVAEALNIKRGLLMSAHRSQVYEFYFGNEVLGVQNPAQFLSYILNQISYLTDTQKQKLERDCTNDLNSKELGLHMAGKSRRGLAAALVYYRIQKDGTDYYDQKITQKSLSQAAKVTEVTIRNRYKDLVKLWGNPKSSR